MEVERRAVGFRLEMREQMPGQQRQSALGELELSV